MTGQNNNRKKFLSTTALTLGLMALGVPAMAMDDFTTPTGEQVVGGAASFDRPAAGTLNVNQSTDRVVINWGSFNIGKSGKTEFFQPNAGSLAVNRVTGADNNPTQILGTLKGNGRIMVLDRNGIFFGADAVLDVGSIVASTGDVDNNAIMRGDSVLTLNNFGDGSVINNGLIRVSDAGLAAFVAPHVANNGIIQARMGKVALAAGGESATVDLYGDGLVELAVGGAQGKALAENAGTIDAEGGTVLMSATAAKGVVDDVINMNGVVKVSSVTQKGGKIILSGGSSGKVKVTGTLDASGENGGQIDVRGQDIDVGQTAMLLADGGQNGDGGEIVIFGDSYAVLNGRASARGGVLGGNGGFIELSAKETVGFDGSVSTFAAFGNLGTFLIDPRFIIIHSLSHVLPTNGTIPATGNTNYVVSAQALANAMATTNVILQADDFIDVGSRDTYGGILTPAELALLPMTGLGTGDIDVSTGTTIVTTYIPTDAVPGDSNYPGRLNACMNNGGGNKCAAVNTTTTTLSAGNLTLDSAVVNINRTLTLGTGNLIVDAATLNLGAQILGRSTLGGATAVLGDSRLIGTADLGTINVLSNNARIQQAIGFADDDTALTTIQVDAGTYNESVLVNKNKVALMGAASFGSVVTPNSPGFNVLGDNVVINGFAVSGASGADGYGIWVNGADNATISNNLITNSAQSGIQFSNTQGGAALNNRITGSGDSGVRLDNSHNVVVNTNTISGSAIDGVRAFNSDFLTANNNVIQANGSGIGIWNSDDGSFSGNTIAANVGFYIGNSSDRAKVLNNAINGASYGVLVWAAGGAGSHDALIKGNTINGGFNGVLVLDSNGVVIGGALPGDGNTVTGTAGTAIGGQNAGTLQVIGNTVANAGDDGIGVSNSAGTVIRGNTLNATTDNAIFLDGVEGGTVALNTISGAGNRGIFVNGGLSGVTLEGNDIGFTGGDGIRVQNTQANVGTKVFLTMNNVHDSKNGISILNSQNVLADMNFVGYAKAGPGSYVGQGLDNIDGDGLYIEASHGAVIKRNVVALTGSKTGIFDVGSGIHVKNSNNVVVGGVNEGNTILLSDWDGIKISGGDNIRVDSNYVWDVERVGIYAGSVTNSSVENNTLINANTLDIDHGAISADFGSGLEIAGNTISGTTRDHGVRLNGVGGTNLIRNNTISNVTGDGAHVEGTSSLTIDQNDITGAGRDGIYATGGSGYLKIGAGLLVDSNVIVNAGDDGIDVENTGADLDITYNQINGTGLAVDHNGIEISGTTGAVIDHNDVKNAGWDGINVQASTNAAVTWNVIDGTKGASGIGAVNGVNGLNVDRNTVTNSKQFGMYIGAIAGDLTITNNTVRGVTDSDGIYVTDNSASPVVTGNTVDAVGRDAISINDGSHAEVNGNWIGLGANHVVGGGDDSVIGRDGIRIVNADHSTANGNKIANTAGNGIFVDPSPFSQINNNVITGFGLGANGIFLDDGDDSEILGNTVTGNNGAGQTGIRVNNSDRVRVGHGTLPVNRNTVSNVGTGIAAVNGANITLRNNSVSNTGNGITLDLITGISKIVGNRVNNSSGNGIQVWNSEDVLVGDAGGANVNTITNTGWDGVNVQGGDDITVRNNTITTVTGASGVAVLNSTNATVTGNGIDDTDRLGVYAGNADNIRITDNIITDAGLENAGNYLSGIHVEASDTVTVTGNDVNRAKGDGINLGDGINWFDGTNTGTLIVSGNTVRNVARDGIHGGANIDQVNGNVVYKTGNDGIWLDGSHGVEVKNNKIGVNSSNATQGNNNVGGDGIQINNSNNALISGNRVREAAFNGIFVDPSDDVEIAYNNIALSGTNGIYLLDGNRGNIHNNTVDESGQDGIKVDNNAEVRVHDNNIDDSGDSGIEVWNSFNADIVDNSVTDSVGDGIALGNSAWAEIRGNNVTDSGDDGIDAEGSDDVVVNDNTVDESSFNGIEISGSNHAEIGGNTITRAGIDGINLEGGRAGWIHDNHILGTNGGFFTTGVAGAGRDGIHVENNRNVLIEDNMVRSGNAGFFSIGGVGALENGIYVADSNRADILNNRIESGAPFFFFFGSDSVGQNGIVLVRSARSLVNGNEIEDTGHNGIVVRNSAETEVSANALDDIGNHGIRILGSEDNLVSGNTLNDVAGHGIDLGPTGGNFSDGTRVQFNTLADIGGDGIHAFDTYSLVVFDNDLLDIDGHGIYVDQGSGTVIEQNTIIAFGGDGIRIDEDFGSAEITNNLIAFGGGDGIDVRNANQIEIHDNGIGFVGDDGIDVSDSRVVDIRRNTVDFVLGNGIEVSGSNRVRIINNDVGLNGFIGENGIDVRGSNRVRIARNDIGTNVQKNGIYVNPSNFVTIARNTIDGVGQNGIMLNGNDRVRLMSNVISNSGSHGLFVAGADNTYVFLADNTFTDNPIGAEFESGEIDMTGAKNTFNGGDVALRFAPVPVKGGFAPMNLAGNTIGETIFTGQSTYYIELANGAFFAPGSPTILDGFHATYDGFRPDTVPYLTQAQYDAIEAKIYHYNDLNSLGLFFFGMVPSINQEDIYKNFRGLDAGPGRLRITILGLPRLTGGAGAGNAADFASFLANIAPAAGGDDAQQSRTPMAQDLTAIEPAAGGTGNGAGGGAASEAACWSQAMAQASAGAAVSYSFGGSMEEAISQTAACGTGVSL